MKETNQRYNNSTKTLMFVVGGCLFLCLCLACTVILGSAGYYFFAQQTYPTLAPATAVSPTPPATEISGNPTTAPGETAIPKLPETPPLPPTKSLPINLDIPPEIDQRPVPESAFISLERLMSANFPAQDYFETAVRLGHKSLGSRIVERPEYQEGDRQTFFVEEGTVNATLVTVTKHTYFWVEEGLEVNDQEIAAAAKRLENNFYPRLVTLFGQEWQPGVDDDPHFSILHLIGSTSAGELGYFSNVDEFPQSLYADSNEQEIIYLNMAQLDLGSDLYFGTLVHEIQHLIQWYVDANEAAWLNEGLSQLAEIYVGFDTAETFDYERKPEVPLNSWNYDEDMVDAHYSASYLYLVYIWEQLGDAAVQELARHPADGMAAVNKILEGFDGSRDLSQFTADWVAANYLDDAAAGPPYYYRNLDPRRPSAIARWRDIPQNKNGEIEQFGTHFIDLDFRGDVRIQFAGDTIAPLSNARPLSGASMWFAPPINEVDAQLTHEFDLTNLSQATFSFSSWYDLEEDWDFGYVSISIDGGQNWDLLPLEHAASGEFGPAFNGSSLDVEGSESGWVNQSISLDQYAGQFVQIRFDILTDSAITGRGFALDDIGIPELGYFTDLEDDSGGWLADGFVLTNWLVPQRWVVQLITNGSSPQVTRLKLNELNQGEWAVSIGKSGGVLAITPVTPFTNDPGQYWLQVQK